MKNSKRVKAIFRVLCKYLSGDLAKQATLEIVEHPDYKPRPKR